MIKFFLSRVLAWAAKISWADFLLIATSASHAATIYPKPDVMTEEQNKAINANRAAHVSTVISRSFKELPTWAVNLVRELAVAWLNRSKK